MKPRARRAVIILGAAAVVAVGAGLFLAAPAMTQLRAVLEAEAVAGSTSDTFAEAVDATDSWKASERGQALFALDVFDSPTWTTYVDDVRRDRSTASAQRTEVFTDPTEGVDWIPGLEQRFDAAIKRIGEQPDPEVVATIQAYAALNLACYGSRSEILPSTVVDAIVAAAPELCKLPKPMADEHS